MNIFEQLEAIYTKTKLDLDNLTINKSSTIDPKLVESVNKSFIKVSEDIQALHNEAENTLLKIKSENSLELSMFQLRCALRMNKDKLCNVLPELEKTYFCDEKSNPETYADEKELPVNQENSENTESTKTDEITLENANEFINDLKKDLKRLQGIFHSSTNETSSDGNNQLRTGYLDGNKVLFSSNDSVFQNEKTTANNQLAPSNDTIKHDDGRSCVSELMNDFEEVKLMLQNYKSSNYNCIEPTTAMKQDDVTISYLRANIVPLMADDDNKAQNVFKKSSEIPNTHSEIPKNQDPPSILKSSSSCMQANRRSNHPSKVQFCIDDIRDSKVEASCHHGNQDLKARHRLDFNTIQQNKENTSSDFGFST